MLGSRPAQTVKELLLSSDESRGFLAILETINEYKAGKGVFPTPICQLFQIHGSKFKPDPSRDGGQASVVCITHRVFLLRIRKDPFNGFFALCIYFFCTIRFSYLFDQIQILLPDVRCVYLLPLFICAAFRLAGTISALRRCASVGSFPLPVGGRMS